MPAWGEGVLGGHAVKAVGYDDKLAVPHTAPGGFWAKNSWDTGWGAEGYFFMPYTFMLKRGCTSDFWTIRTIE
jgi:C1A family cysteine protease